MDGKYTNGWTEMFLRKVENGERTIESLIELKSTMDQSVRDGHLSESAPAKAGLNEALDILQSTVQDDDPLAPGYPDPADDAEWFL